MSEPIRYVAVFGGPGSGKRTVAEALAERLGWTFVDFDAEITRREGNPVPHLVDALREEEVHRLTTSLVDEAILPRQSVVAFDSRWPGNGSALEQMRPRTLSVWLSASPEEAVRRMRGSNRRHRLLEHPRPAEAVSNGLKTRASMRNEVDLKIPTDGLGVQEVAFQIEQIVRNRGCGEV